MTQGGRIEQFLFREARLLDERRWEDWLALWDADASYSMPTRRTEAGTGASHPIAGELTPDGGAWWFDEGLDMLSTRIAKLRTGKAWAEEPPSRTRRFVTNVEWHPLDRADAVGALWTVRSNQLIYRGRRDSDVEWYSCGRKDILLESTGAARPEFRIVSRRVVIDSNVVRADNLLLFF